MDCFLFKAITCSKDFWYITGFLHVAQVKPQLVNKWIPKSFCHDIIWACHHHPDRLYSALISNALCPPLLKCLRLAFPVMYSPNWAMENRTVYFNHSVRLKVSNNTTSKEADIYTTIKGTEFFQERQKSSSCIFHLNGKYLFIKSPLTSKLIYVEYICATNVNHTQLTHRKYQSQKWLINFIDWLIWFFWFRHAACGILVPQPGIKPVHWEQGVLITGLPGKFQLFIFKQSFGVWLPENYENYMHSTYLQR